jgi:ketosteroid isomerase-like protein
MAGNDFDGFIDEYRSALQAMVSGDPAPVLALFSSRDDVTLANPLGPPCRGRAAVEEASRRAAANFRDGSMTFEELSRVVTAQLGYVVEIERATTRLATTNDMDVIPLRVTTILRQEDGAWKIVHRHADPLTGPRPASAIAERDAR